MRRAGPLLAAGLAAAAVLGACGGGDSKSSGSGGGNSGGGNVFAGKGGKCKDADDALKKAAAGHVVPVTQGSRKGQADSISTDVCRTDDENATAVVVVKGLHDPLIKDVRHEIRLIKSGGIWQVVDDADTRICQPGHGSQTYEGGICS